MGEGGGVLRVRMCCSVCVTNVSVNQAADWSVFMEYLPCVPFVMNTLPD